MKWPHLEVVLLVAFEDHMNIGQCFICDVFELEKYWLAHIF